MSYVDAQNAQLLESDTSVQPYSSPEAEVVQEANPTVEEGRSKCTFCLTKCLIRFLCTCYMYLFIFQLCLTSSSLQY